MENTVTEEPTQDSQITFTLDFNIYYILSAVMILSAVIVYRKFRRK